MRKRKRRSSVATGKSSGLARGWDGSKSGINIHSRHGVGQELQFYLAGDGFFLLARLRAKFLRAVRGLFGSGFIEVTHACRASAGLDLQILRIARQVGDQDTSAPTGIKQ